MNEKEDGLILESSDSLTGAKLDSENDHRLFMAFCIAGTYMEMHCNGFKISGSIISQFYRGNE